MVSKSKKLTLSAFLLLFYFSIITYVLFAMLHIDTLVNFYVGMTFEAIGELFLAILVLGNIISKPIKTGYFIPIVFVTVIYTILLNVLIMGYIATMSTSVFMLLNLSLLFLYCLISIPMYIMGKR